MYLVFYRLKSAPFPLTPDPTLLFVSPSHKTALDALTYGITARKSLVVITGASGVGKPPWVPPFRPRAPPPQIPPLVLWQPRLSFMEILPLLARRFAIPVATDD